MQQTKLALVLIALGLVCPVAVNAADGPVRSFVTNTVLSRLSQMGQSIAAPIKQALCLKPEEESSILRPDGMVLSGELDFAKLLPATRATGLSTSLGGFLWMTYARGEEDVHVQAYIVPSAGMGVPGASAKEVPGNAYVGLAFNCATNPHQSDYFLEVGAGGPLGFNFFFDMNVQNLMEKAMLAGDPSNTPRTFEKIMSTARTAEPELREAVDELDRRSRSVEGELGNRLLSAYVPRWHDDDPAEGRPISHWIDETAKAAQATARLSSSADNLTRRVEDFLARLKGASEDPLERVQLEVDVQQLYLDLGGAIRTLALATFPLTIGRSRRELFAKMTDEGVRDFWIKRPSGNYRHYCFPTDRFIAVNSRAEGGWTKKYYDCHSGSLLRQAPYDSARAWLRASRTLVERADNYRAALWDLTHVVNNTYAQYLTGQKVRPESVRVGGTYTGPVFTGCFGIEVSLVSLAKTGAALFRQASALARNALSTTPASATELVATMGTQVADLGYPPWSPSASLSYPYAVGKEVKIPLTSMPKLWRMVFAGECE